MNFCIQTIFKQYGRVCKDNVLGQNCISVCLKNQIDLKSTFQIGAHLEHCLFELSHGKPSNFPELYHLISEDLTGVINEDLIGVQGLPTLLLLPLSSSLDQDVPRSSHSGLSPLHQVKIFLTQNPYASYLIYITAESIYHCLSCALLIDLFN